MHREKVIPEVQRREQQIRDSIDRGIEEVQRRNEERLRREQAMREEVNA